VVDSLAELNVLEPQRIILVEQSLVFGAGGFSLGHGCHIGTREG
jgi:hypothetical protein